MTTKTTYITLASKRVEDRRSLKKLSKLSKLSLNYNCL